MSSNQPVVAFCYDFDGTLAPGYMQNHALLPELSTDSDGFWRSVKRLAREQKGDQIHAYMHLLIQKAKSERASISKKRWRERGHDLPLYAGVAEWFARQNARAAELGLELEHYIVSSGIREMIEGSPIASEFRKIYASAFLYSPDKVAEGVALTVNYTTKTQYLFRINKGTLDEWDDDKINEAVAKPRRRVPFERMVFFGDGETDVPCMRLVTEQGGAAVAVYDAGEAKAGAAALRLRDEGRALDVSPVSHPAVARVRR